MFLDSLGADAALYHLFEPYAARGLVLARVAVSQRDRYHLFAETGDLSAEASGALWYQTTSHAGMPVTGDWVAARISGPHQAIVEGVLPRKTLFSRRAAGKREAEQPVAANIDVVFLVCGLDFDFNLRRLERYLALVAEAGAEPVVVLNKADVCPDLAVRLAETAAVARDAQIVAVSTMTPKGLEGLRPFLIHGRTVALLGSSGVGKSSIVNRLLGEDRLQVGQLRESDGRGRHTTTHRELIPLPDGGAVIDTPGMRELQLWAGQESVDQTFADISSIASQCRYRMCSHSGEGGCAIAEAIADGLLSEDRLESYRKLLAEAKRHEDLANPLAAAEKKKSVRALHKGMRAFYRQRDR